MGNKIKEVQAEIENFLLWYYHKNYDESTGKVRDIYNAIDHYVDEVMDLEQSCGHCQGKCIMDEYV